MDLEILGTLELDQNKDASETELDNLEDKLNFLVDPKSLKEYFGKMVLPSHK